MSGAKLARRGNPLPRQTNRLRCTSATSDTLFDQGNATALHDETFAGDCSVSVRSDTAGPLGEVNVRQIAAAGGWSLARAHSTTDIHVCRRDRPFGSHQVTGLPAGLALTGIIADMCPNLDPFGSGHIDAFGERHRHERPVSKRTASAGFGLSRANKW